MATWASGKFASRFVVSSCCDSKRNPKCTGRLGYEMATTRRVASRPWDVKQARPTVL